MNPSDLIEDALGLRPLRLHPLQGGASGGVFQAELPGGELVVAKVGAALGVEAGMLDYLATSTELPVPTVLHSSEGLLVMEYVDNDGRRTEAGEEEAAELVAALHDHASSRYGFPWDTAIGGLPQPNPWTSSWIDFFARHRLLHMAEACVDAGRMPGEALHKVERLCARLDRWLDPAPSGDRSGSLAGPSLVHGDLWGGNVLWREGRVVAFIDPAIHFADPEVEIAFTTLFGTFGNAFYRRYNEIRPLRPGFLEARKNLLNLYPLLVHVRLFGGVYLASVERTLGRFVRG